jgi:uncharacterized protein YkwD
LVSTGWGEAVAKRVAIVVISLLLAATAAMVFWVVNPETARTANGGYVKKCGGGEIFLNEKEKKTFLLHNQVRRNHDLPAFCVHPKLQKAARAHSKDMIERDYFSHDTMDRNEGACERVRRYGYDWRACGENIAYGSGSNGEPDSIMSDWMNSPDHRGNILNGKFREIGIGTYTGNYEGFDDVTMYTADFGAR